MLRCVICEGKEAFEFVASRFHCIFLEAEGIVEILVSLFEDWEGVSSKMREHVFKAFFLFVVRARILHEEFHVWSRFYHQFLIFDRVEYKIHLVCL